MQVVPIPCLRDNYAYLVTCEATQKAIVVDPSQAEPILAAIRAAGVTLVAIWNTHHHWDHTGGNKALVREYPHLEVVGHASDKGRIPGQTVFVNDGDEILVGETVSARVVHNPGHTSGAISFYIGDSNSVFTGDTLFAAGCGRLFEGTPQQMRTSLERLGALPPETSVYCGHEYTENNLRFASTVEPSNPDVIHCLANAVHYREQGQTPPPSTIAQERQTNPFLRTTVTEVASNATHFAKQQLETPTDVFAALRRWKDEY